jgi:membrane protease YdiL (CAAX protease family)
MNKYLRISSARSQLALFFILMGGAFIVLILLSSILLHFVNSGTSTTPDWSDPRMAGVLKLQQVLSSIVIFLLPAWLFARFTYRERNLYFLGFRPAEKSNFYLLAVMILLFSFPMEAWLGQLNQQIPLWDWMNQLEKEATKQLTVLLKANSPLDIFISIFTVAIIPAICEESLFRGVLQPILIRLFKNPWIGIIVTGLFFSAIHMQFQGFLPRAFLGVVLGAIYWYSNSLWVSILAHFFYNGIQVIALYSYPKMINENPSVPMYAALISIVIVVGLLSAMRRQSTVTYAGVFGADDEHDFPG